MTATVKSATHRGAQLIVTTTDGENEWETTFAATPPPLERDEEGKVLYPNYPTEEAELALQPFEHDQASWVKTCAAEAVALHESRLEAEAQPEEDLTHLLG